MNPQLMFWAGAALMMALALAMVLPALLRPRRGQGAERQDNLAAARERLADLQERLAGGEIEPATAAEQEDEIRAQLLSDADGDDDRPAAKPARVRRDLAGCLLVAATVLVATPALYWKYGSPQLTGTDAPDMAAVKKRLEMHVAAEPDDIQALLLLARVTAVQGQFAEAARHYEKARATIGDTPDLLASNINALIAGNSPDTAKIDRLLEKALKLSPASPQIQWLAGLQAEAKGLTQEAIEHWERAREGLAGSPEQQEAIAAVIRDARQGGQQGAAAPAPVEQAPSAAAASGGVAVKVQLGEGFSPPPQTPLFIFARAEGGAPPMPLAAVRRMAGDLPIETRLDDSSAMNPAMKMSLFETYEIVARVSFGGSPTAASGDLFGSVAAVASGATVTVVIDQRVP